MIYSSWKKIQTPHQNSPYRLYSRSVLLHVSLSEYSVTQLRFSGRIFKLVSQVEDTCLIKARPSPPTIHSPQVLGKIYLGKIKSLKFRHFKENKQLFPWMKLRLWLKNNLVLYSIAILFLVTTLTERKCSFLTLYSVTLWKFHIDLYSGKK